MKRTNIIRAEKTGILVLQLFSAFVLIWSASILLGWTFYLWLSPEIRDAIVATKPNSAVCFILSAIAIWISAENKPENPLNIISRLCGGIIFLIAILTLFQYFFHINIGIDEALFKEPSLSEGSYLFPGRMSPLNAINFALIGFSLFTLDSRFVKANTHQVVMFIVIIISFLIFLGHLYQLDNSAIVGLTDKYSQLSIASTLATIAIAISIIFVRPYQGILKILSSYRYGGTLARRLIPAAILLPILSGYLVKLAGKEVGIQGAQLGMALFVITTIIMFTALILINAYFVDKADYEREEAEQQLRINQSQLQAILDHTSAVIYVQNSDGSYRLVNNQFEKVFRKRARDIIGKKPNDIFSRNFSDSIAKTNNTVIQTLSPIAIEEVIEQNGEMNMYISNKFPLFNESGNVYAVGDISTDITKIKRIEASLRENEERLSLALKSGEVAIWSWDIEKNQVNWDAHMNRLFGMRERSAPNTLQDIISLIHPDDRDKFEGDVERVLEEESEFDLEFRVIHQNKITHTLGSRGKLHRDNMGIATKMIGVCWDITKQKFVEDELRRAKIAAEDLADKAESANRAKSAFLATMSHEIRTPLNGVIGMTGLLLETELNPEQKEYIETIRVSGEALLSVINDILDFSKIESGRLELERMDFDITNLVYDLIEITASQVHKKGIAIAAEIDPNVPIWLNGDFSRIRQVLNNLLSNAAKFTETGQIAVHVKTVNKSSTESTILFEVKDSGIGMSQDVIERVFQPFMQGDISTSRKYGGTGLGLVISKRLIEMMGGTIGVDSYPGRGSTFWFTIPLQECTSAVPIAEYKPIPELKGKRVICVDDNSINRDTIKKQLESWGLECTTAANAAEALSLLNKASSSNPYHLAMIDQFMPAMDGIELIRIIRQLKVIKHIPIILLSTLGTTLTFEELKDLNISMSITKPIRQNKLYGSIIAVLKEMKGKAQTITESKIIPTKSRTKKKSRILLAEDNSINQQVALKILAKLGYQAEAVANGKEVIDAIKQVPYDLILMDCQMPEMDGYTTTKEIRRREQTTQQHMPIVAMTAHALKGDRQKCLDSGMDDYLSKPFDAKTLEEILEKFLGEIDANYDSEPVIIASESTDMSTKKLEEFFDMERLHDIFGESDDDIKQFIDSFIVATEALIKETDDAIKKKDPQTVKNLLHQLKGSSGNSGVESMRELCMNAESKALEKDWASVDTLFSSVKTLFDKIKNAAATV